MQSPHVSDGRPGVILRSYSSGREAHVGMHANDLGQHNGLAVVLCRDTLDPHTSFVHNLPRT